MKAITNVHVLEISNIKYKKTLFKIPLNKTLNNDSPFKPTWTKDFQLINDIFPLLLPFILVRTQFPTQDWGIKGVKCQTLHLSYRLVLSKMEETDKIMDEVLSIF